MEPKAVPPIALGSIRFLEEFLNLLDLTRLGEIAKVSPVSGIADNAHKADA